MQPLIQTQPRQYAHEAPCSFDMITTISKILLEAKQSFGVKMDAKSLYIDLKSEKSYKKLIEENFQKPKPAVSAYDEESKEGEEGPGGMMMDGSTRETTAVQSKKSPEMLQIEDEYNALMQQSIVLRRGRCGRIFAKYVQKSIFEDLECGNGNASDNEDEKSGGAPALKKRRKRY